MLHLKLIIDFLHPEPFSPQASFMENPLQYNNKLQCSSTTTQANINKGNVSKNDRTNFNNYEANEMYNPTINQCVSNSKNDSVFNNVITIDDENKNNANTPINENNFNMMSEGLKLKLSNLNKRKRIDDEFYMKNNSNVNDNKMQLVNNEAMSNEGITRIKIEGNSTEANPPFDNNNMYIDNNTNMKLFPVPSPRPFQASSHQELLVTRQINRAYSCGGNNNMDDSNINNINSDSFNSFGNNNDNASNITFGSGENNNDSKNILVNNGGKFEGSDARMNVGTAVINDSKSVDSKVY